MTHDPDQPTRIDGKKIADLPFGIHLDTVEVKWILAGVLAGLGAVVSGQIEVAGAFALAALGIRLAPGPLKDYRRQPWWALGGILVGLLLGGIVTVLVNVAS